MPSLAATVVARELAKLPPSGRVRFLKELANHALAGIIVIGGEREAVEFAYVLAESIVQSGEPEGR